MATASCTSRRFTLAAPRQSWFSTSRGVSRGRVFPAPGWGSDLSRERQHLKVEDGYVLHSGSRSGSGLVGQPTLLVVCHLAAHLSGWHTKSDGLPHESSLAIT